MTAWAETEQTLANDLRIIAKSFDKYANRGEALTWPDAPAFLGWRLLNMLSFCLTFFSFFQDGGLRRQRSAVRGY